MSFIEEFMKDIVLDGWYKLTEVVEGKEVSSGEYQLISITERKGHYFPALGFGKTKQIEPEIYLTEAHAQMGNPTWRHAFRSNNSNGWEIYEPAGALTWTHSYVKVEKIERS